MTHKHFWSICQKIATCKVTLHKYIYRITLLPLMDTDFVEGIVTEKSHCGLMDQCCCCEMFSLLAVYFISDFMALKPQRAELVRFLFLFFFPAVTDGMKKNGKKKTKKNRRSIWKILHNSKPNAVCFQKTLLYLNSHVLFSRKYKTQVR